MFKQLKRNHTALILTLVISVILLISIVSVFFIYKKKDSSSLSAEIYQNGKCIKTINLSEVKKAYTFKVTGKNGTYNEIKVMHNKIGICDASCPDKLCVHMGFISSPAIPVTCLPNKVIIKIIDNKSSDSEIDSVVY